MVRVKVFTFNMFAENTIILWDEETKQAAVVDPGNSKAQEDEMLSEYIISENLKVKYLINTHCHIDHILGCKFVKNKFNPIYLAPEKDLPLLEHSTQQAEMFDIKISEPPKPDELILEETNLCLGESKLNFLFTPGHTPGEVCIYLKKEKICMTGDVLFNESIGRTDLWGGNYVQLMESIQTKLFTLPDDITIYPGHGEKSTIGYEKQNNPFIV